MCLYTSASSCIKTQNILDRYILWLWPLLLDTIDIISCYVYICQSQLYKKRGIYLMRSYRVCIYVMQSCILLSVSSSFGYMLSLHTFDTSAVKYSCVGMVIVIIDFQGISCIQTNTTCTLNKKCDHMYFEGMS